MEMVACKIGIHASVATVLEESQQRDRGYQGAPVEGADPAVVNVDALVSAIAALDASVDSAALTQHIMDGLKSGHYDADSMSEYLCLQLGAE